MPENRNRFTFGLGTIGRDMAYALVSMYLMFYLTDILELSDAVIALVTAVLVAERVFDALNDPIMGVIVDNTQTRFGKFKPWMASGALLSAIFTVLLFTDFKLTGAVYAAVFAAVLLFWDLSFTMNDISYWSMLPSLSMDQKEREKIGTFAKICGSLGMYAVVVGIVPLTTAFGKAFGSMKQGYFIFSVIVVLIMLAGQCVTLFGVKEPKGVFKREESTGLRGMIKAIAENDQLLYIAVSMVLFMIGYVTTTSFGLYYFKYAFKNEGMYSVFAAILGASQILAFTVFPAITKKLSRKTLYAGSTMLVAAGYILFFFSPPDMLFVGAAGILIFIGEAFINVLMLMFLMDTVEYGQWKLGKRNESVTLALQPVIFKMGGAAASGIVGITVILSGINKAASVADVTESGLLLMKCAMLILPLIFILIGYIVYRAKYKIDSDMYSKIVSELEERGDITLKG
jgi:melibiose permease/lactose/raffinose/galactose permease